LLPLPNFELEVPGDFSSAAFLITAACLVPGSDLEINGVGLNPLRTGLLDVLQEMGASLEVETTASDPEPVGTIRVKSGQLKATSVSGELIPRTLDELSLVALAATQADGTTVVKDAEELRVKEADRIAVLASGLRTVGAEVEEFSDGFAVTGPSRLHGGLVDPDGDHRMALGFAVAGLIASDPVTITGWECSRISFPEFEEDLANLRAE
ncbi:MAG: 3-phosphoshikimate 1-carboxyvinyltransferase, partial [Acidimicrobiia bacterium]